MACSTTWSIRWLLAGAVCLLASPAVAQSTITVSPGQERFIRLDDGLYELNADGTYHKVPGSTANSPRPPSVPSRPSTNPSPGRFTGQERFIRFDDGLYERMADGTYIKVDGRRPPQPNYNNNPPQWIDNNPPQWIDNNPPQWIDNNPPQWINNRPPIVNNNRPPQWNNNRPPAVDPWLMNNTDQGMQAGTGNPTVQPGRPPRPPAVDSMLMNGTGQETSASAETDPWYELGLRIQQAIEAEAGRKRRGR